MLRILLATLRVTGNYFKMYNMNVTNDAGQAAQAVALSTGGNYQGFYSSSLLGWQDTTYVHTGTQWFSRCYIEGAVDFIYGTTANAWFVCLHSKSNCLSYWSNDILQQGITIGSVRAGPVTAQGRGDNISAGYFVFDKA
jgi:pectinesterase